MWREYPGGFDGLMPRTESVGVRRHSSSSVSSSDGSPKSHCFCWFPISLEVLKGRLGSGRSGSRGYEDTVSRWRLPYRTGLS